MLVVIWYLAQGKAVDEGISAEMVQIRRVLHRCISFCQLWPAIHPSSMRQIFKKIFIYARFVWWFQKKLVDKTSQRMRLPS